MKTEPDFYHFMAPFNVRFEAGYPIASDIPGTQEIQRRELPGGKAVTAQIPDSNLGQGQKQFPWVIQYAEDHGYRVDDSWGGNGGWHVLETIRSHYHDVDGRPSRIFLPVGK
ncbi:MAG: hypothetical protein QGI68_18185 [Pseudomonadales bacterium]|nr:hypothetical protein [Pseudomonadales bacterium]MDP7597474.1 hypothetical protein [Pseudomonadales bacterium]HJN49215.1 hypothetical protein [Pseudomonadales bacterium]